MDFTGRYFSNFNGALEQLDQLFPMSIKEFEQRWPGVRGFRNDCSRKWAGRSESGELLPMTHKPGRNGQLISE